MQFIRQQSARWSVGRPPSEDGNDATAATNIAPRKDDDHAEKPSSRTIVEEEQKEEEQKETSNNGEMSADPTPAQPQLQDRIASVSSFLQRRKSSILRMSRDVSQQAQQQAAAAAAAYEAYQQNKMLEQEDPVLQRTLQQMQTVHEKIKQQQQTNRAEMQDYQKELNEIKSQKSAMARDLWLKQQSNRLNPLGLNQYRELFLPEQTDAGGAAMLLDDNDASTTSLILEKEHVKQITAQAKLCRAQHNEWMTDRQMTMMRTFQQEMIDFMFHGMLPTLKSEAVQVEAKGKDHVEKMKQHKQELEELHMKITSLQEKILQEYRSQLTPEEVEAIRQELEAEKVAAAKSDEDEEKEQDEQGEEELEEELENDADSSSEEDEGSDEENADDSENQVEQSKPTLAESSSLGTPTSRMNQPLGSTSSTHEKTAHEFSMNTEPTTSIPEAPTSATTPTGTPTGTPDQTGHKTTEDGTEALPARIAERARQRDAMESSEKIRTAPGKTSSRSDLLERARNARKQSAAAMNDSPVKAGGRPTLSRRSSGSTQDVNGTMKAPMTAAERVAARRNFAATRTNLSARQLNVGSNHQNKDRPTVTATKSGLSEERRAQIRNGLRAGSTTASS
jgi:hypothetical protein